MRVVTAPSFARTAKKLHKNQKADLDTAVRALVDNPLLGDAKVGDLAGVRVFKFRMAGQLCLLAYAQPDEDALELLALRQRENFYRDIKR
jgi:mRNA-degrading endonuclease RelE of RelBE toxin-antitoxin system